MSLAYVNLFCCMGSFCFVARCLVVLILCCLMHSAPCTARNERAKEETTSNRSLRKFALITRHSAASWGYGTTPVVRKVN
eukprot:3638689-Amphidinium_carterae.1